MRCRSSTPGPACCRPRSSSAGASSRRSGSSRMVRGAMPDAKIIGFPRGAGTVPAALRARSRRRCRRPRLDGRPRVCARADPIARCRCRAISIRWCWSPAARRSTGRSMRSSKRFAGGRFIFNLGHGIVPETPIAHVERCSRACVGASADPPCTTGSRHSTSSRSSPGWPGCSICRGCSSITASAEPGSTQSETFKVMERRLLNAIINPAMVVTWVLGFGSPGRAAGFLSQWLAHGQARAGAGAVRRAWLFRALGARFRRRPRTGIPQNSIVLSMRSRRS